MPDAPKCEYCNNNGIAGQTYKISGKPLYRCQSCKQYFKTDSFVKEQLEWKDDVEKYKKWREEKKLKPIAEKQKNIKVKNGA